MNVRPMKLFCLSLLLVAAHCADAAILDPSFGDAGRVAVDVGRYGDQANAVVAQPNGKILVGGSASNTIDLDFMVFRLLADGSLDPTFNYDGTVSTAVGASDDEILTLGLQDDGKIIAAGYSSKAGNRDFALVRYNSDGSLDRDFGQEGMVVTPVSDSDDEITDVAIQPDGGIVLAGSALGAEGRVVVLARYLTDGTPDPAFADEGFSLSTVGRDAQAESVALTDDGRIIVSGSYSDEDRTGLMLLGFDGTGQIDREFGHEGVGIPADGGIFSAGYGIFTRDDGRILVAGSVGKTGERDAALFQFREDGLPDSGFSDNGALVTAVETSDDVLYDVLVTGDVIAAIGVMTGENGEREAIFITYTESMDTGQDSEDLLRGQVAEENSEDTDKLTAEIFTTEADNNENSALAFTLASPNSVVVAGVSGAQDVASAEVSKYMLAISITGSSSGASSWNQYILTGEPYGVTRTTAIIPVEILADLGTVTKRGIVFDTAPHPVLTDSESSDGGDNSDAPARSDLAPSGTVSSTSVTLTLTTDVDATCKYTDSGSGIDYEQMSGDFDTTGGTSHSESISNLVDGVTYSYYVRCASATGIANTTDSVISFTVDEGAPVITNETSSSFLSTQSVSLSVSTAEEATCNYNADSDADYLEMEAAFSATSGTSHSVEFGTLSTGTYIYYVRCMDENGNTNSTGTKISFTVTDDDTSPPEITDNTGDVFSTTDTVTLSVTTNENAICGYATSSGGQLVPFSVTGGTTHSSSLGSLLSGEYTYYVRCIDDVDNYSSEEKIYFVVTPVVITDINYASGSLSVTTDVSATCRYSDSDSDYTSMTDQFTGAGTTNHSALITLPTGSYTYYVRCEDTSGDTSPTGTEISFTVATHFVPGGAEQDYATQISPAADSNNIIRAGFFSTLQSVGDLFVGTAIAQVDSTDSTTTTDTTTTDDEGGVDDDFLEEGSTDEGSGIGEFSGKLENLKPGTFFYARAYAVVDGTTYYGKQVGFRTADSCFVATAAFGSLFHPSVTILRDFRDQFMLNNSLSRSLVNLYYRYSPPVADIISSNSILRPVTRVLLLPVVGAAWLTMRLGWLWLLLPAAAMIIFSWYGMRSARTGNQGESI